MSSQWHCKEASRSAPHGFADTRLSYCEECDGQRGSWRRARSRKQLAIAPESGWWESRPGYALTKRSLTKHLTFIAPECLSPQSGADDKQKRVESGRALHEGQSRE